MSTTLSVPTVAAKIVWDYESVQSWGNSVNAAQFSYSQAYTAGTGANQADTIYLTTGTIAASGSTTIDLTALTDIYGNNISFARVKALYFELQTTTTASSVSIGNAAANQALQGAANFLDAGTDIIRVLNGGCLFFSAGPSSTAFTVDSTHKSLKFLNNDGSNTATYRLCIVGASV